MSHYVEALLTDKEESIREELAEWSTHHLLEARRAARSRLRRIMDDDLCYTGCADEVLSLALVILALGRVIRSR